MVREDYLFTGADSFAVDRHQRDQMANEIKKIDENRLLNSSVDDLAVYLAKKYQIDVPKLLVDDIVVDQREQKIDVSRDGNRYISDRSKPFYITGSEIQVEIPFTGEAGAFRIQPNPFTYNPPRAKVVGSSITFAIVGTNLQADAVRQEINKTAQEIESNLANLRNNVAAMNDQLQGEAKTALEARRAQLLANRNMVASLGFKMKERADAPKTFVAPELRRKIAPAMPAASATPFKPEPVMLMADYEHILGVMHGMTQVMERSPTAFQAADEETLRSHFLVQLNGHYYGQATGETFNYEGKTDILIRSDGKNIFIAECKFWSGPKQLLETIDQLLGYTHWRDTKTAIVIFNRNRDFSKVLAQIPATVRSHPQFKQDVGGPKHETETRYRFANRDDRNRELILTVLAFDIPTLGARAAG